jgi:membrane protease YdiL (CAAX protease family)
MKKLSVSLTRKEKILGWIYYPIQLLILPVLIYLVCMLAGIELSLMLENFIYFCANFLGCSLIFFHFLKENGKIAFKHPLRCLTSAGIGLGIYWGTSYAVQIFIVVVDPDFFNVNDASLGTMIQDNFVLMAIGTVLLVPIAEEVMYRGLFFSQFYNRSPLLAYLLSTCVFAAIHVVGYIGSYEPLQLALCFLQYLPAGIALGFAYKRANSIWASILMHVTINLIGVFAMR